MARSGNRSRRGGRRVLQVREDGDAGAARIDRAISSMRVSESSTMVLCKTTFRILTSTTAPLNQEWTYPQVAATDDFVSLAQQFNEFKVKFMKFEIYHTNPTATAFAVASTCHASVSGPLPSTWTSEAAIVDAPDAKYLQPGSEKQVLYWNASGPQENEYQDVNSFINHGGYRSLLDQSATSQALGTVIATACVVFRGRH